MEVIRVEDNKNLLDASKKKMSNTNTKPLLKYEKALELVEGRQFYNIFLLFLLSYLCGDVCMDLQTLVLMNYSPPRYLCNDPMFQANQTGNSSASLSLSLSPVSNITWYGPNRRTIAPDQQCHADFNLVNGSRLIGYACRSWTFDLTSSQMQNTMVTEFSLVCDRASYVTMVDSMFFAGTVIGNMISMSGDRIGRRLIILVSILWRIVFSIAFPFVRTVWQIMLIRLLMGFSYGGIFQGIVLISEIVPIKKRALYGNNYWFMWVAGFLIMAGLGFVLQDWRRIRLYYLILLIPYAFAVFLVESPRWLGIHGRTKAAVQTLTRIARWNRATTSARTPAAYTNLIVQPIKSTGTLWTLWRSSLLRLRLFVNAYGQACINLCYFALTINSSFITDNIFWNMIIQGLLEIPTGPLGWMMSDRFGRRNSSVGLLFVTVACLTTNTFVPKSSETMLYVKAGFAILGKIMLTTVYVMTEVYLVELFPTDVRNCSMFFCVICGSLANILAPYINRLSVTVWHGLPNIILSSILIVMAIGFYGLLPETRGFHLPQTVEEVEQTQTLRSIRKKSESEYAKDKETTDHSF